MSFYSSLEYLWKHEPGKSARHQKTLRPLPIWVFNALHQRHLIHSLTPRVTLLIHSIKKGTRVIYKCLFKIFLLLTVKVVVSKCHPGSNKHLKVTAVPIPLPRRGVGGALLLWGLALCSLLHSPFHLSNFAVFLSYRHGVFIKPFHPKGTSRISIKFHFSKDVQGNSLFTL